MTETYYDRHGREISINRLVNTEPEWAVNRIKAGERASDENIAIKAAILNLLLSQRDIGSTFFCEVGLEEVKQLAEFLEGMEK